MPLFSIQVIPLHSREVSCRNKVKQSRSHKTCRLAHTQLMYQKRIRILLALVKYGLSHNLKEMSMDLRIVCDTNRKQFVTGMFNKKDVLYCQIH